MNYEGELFNTPIYSSSLIEKDKVYIVDTDKLYMLNNERELQVFDKPPQTGLIVEHTWDPLLRRISRLLGRPGISAGMVMRYKLLTIPTAFLYKVASLSERVRFAVWRWLFKLTTKL